MKCAAEDKIRMLTDAIFLFLAGAFIGWLYEVLLHILKDAMFVNRGMLHGPWLPIYGLGFLIMVWLKKAIGDHPLVYFLAGMTACGIIEYASSWLSETIYHVRWWDYSNCSLNLNGRIFLGGLLGFESAGCIFVFLLLPFLTKQYRKIAEKWRYRFAAILFTVFLADAALSLVWPNVGIGITSYPI